MLETHDSRLFIGLLWYVHHTLIHTERGGVRVLGGVQHAPLHIGTFHHSQIHHKGALNRIHRRTATLFCWTCSIENATYWHLWIKMVQVLLINNKIFHSSPANDSIIIIIAKLNVSWCLPKCNSNWSLVTASTLFSQQLAVIRTCNATSATVLVSWDINFYKYLPCWDRTCSLSELERRGRDERLQVGAARLQ